MLINISIGENFNRHLFFHTDCWWANRKRKWQLSSLPLVHRASYKPTDQMIKMLEWWINIWSQNEWESSQVISCLFTFSIFTYTRYRGQHRIGRSRRRKVPNLKLKEKPNTLNSYWVKVCYGRIAIYFSPLWDTWS